LYRCGFLTPGTRTWEWGVPTRKLTLEITTEGDHIRLENQFIRFDWRPCKPTRGAEPLWQCPGCGRLCRKLYSPPGGLFQCNRCWELRYQVWHDGWWRRRLRQAAQIRTLLEGTPLDGEIPLSARHRCKSKRKIALRAKLREAAAAVIVEVLEDRANDQRSGRNRGKGSPVGS
jgi:hypothetical protein